MSEIKSSQNITVLKKVMGCGLKKKGTKFMLLEKILYWKDIGKAIENFISFVD